MRTKMKKTGTRTERAVPGAGVDIAISGQKVRLRAKTTDDARDDYAWQRDPELSRLDASPVLTMPFADYLLSYVNYLNTPPTKGCRYAIDDLDGRHIGNCTYYNVDWIAGDAEVGIMIGDRRYQGKGYGTDAFSAMVDFIFLNTGLKRLHLKTLVWNRRAQNCFRKCGFTEYGRHREDGYDFVLMELTRGQ
jgi:RimJ/RimL family protein N-acetyltransferase